jgi:hypothetical protein
MKTGTDDEADGGGAQAGDWGKNRFKGIPSPVGDADFERLAPKGWVGPGKSASGQFQIAFL